MSAGNVARDDRASIIVVDVANRRRLKLLGRLHFVDLADADEALAASVALPGYRATVERIALFEVVAIDWNCPQHITQRFTADEVEAVMRPLEVRIGRWRRSCGTQPARCCSSMIDLPEGGEQPDS